MANNPITVEVKNKGSKVNLGDKVHRDYMSDKGVNEDNIRLNKNIIRTEFCKGVVGTLNDVL